MSRLSHDSHDPHVSGNTPQPKIFSIKEKADGRSHAAANDGAPKGPKQRPQADPAKQRHFAGRLIGFTQRLFQQRNQVDEPRPERPANPVSPPRHPAGGGAVQRWVNDPGAPRNVPGVEQHLPPQLRHLVHASLSSSSSSSGPSELPIHLYQGRPQTPSNASVSSHGASSWGHFSLGFMTGVGPLPGPSSNSSGSMEGPSHWPGNHQGIESPPASHIHGYSSNSSVVSQRQEQEPEQMRFGYATLMTPQGPDVAPPVPPRSPELLNMAPPLPLRAPIAVPAFTPAGPVAVAVSPLGMQGFEPLGRNPQTHRLEVQVPFGTQLSYHVDPARGLGIYGGVGERPLGTRSLGVPAPVVEPEATIVRL